MANRSNPFLVFDNTDEQFNVSTIPNIHEGWWDELQAAQQTSQELYEYKMKEVIALAQRNIDRATEYRLQGVMTPNDATLAIERSKNVKMEFEAALSRSGPDQKRLAELEIQQLKQMANGEGIEMSAGSIEEIKIEKQMSNNSNAMAKAANEMKDQEDKLTNLINKQGLQLDAFNKATAALRDAQSKIADGTVTEEEFLKLGIKERAEYQKLLKFQKEEEMARIVTQDITNAKTTIINGLEKASSVLEKGRVFSGGVKGTNWAVKGLTNAIGAYTDPLKHLAKDLTSVQEMLFRSNEAFAKLATEGEDLSRYLAEVNRVSEQEVEKMSETMKAQVKRIAEIKATESTTEEISEAIIAETSKWMSPTWRIIAASKSDLWGLWNMVEQNFLKRWLFRIGGFISLAVTSVFRLARYTVFVILEQTIGRALGNKSVLAIEETINSFIKYKLASSASHLAPEVQLLTAGIYAFWDWFQYHNKNFTFGDTIQFATMGLIPVDGILMNGYPMFSQRGKEVKGLGPSKMWKLDHDEIKTGLDFWGKHFVEMNAKLHGHPKPTYIEYQNFDGYTRKVGKYIDPKKLEYDSKEQLEMCIELEKSLDLGVLVDQTGKLTGVDKGGQMTHALLPRKKGIVRNLVNFPLYENTVVWPDRRGVFVQTKGDFTPDNIDPGILNAFNYWVSTGLWGPAYTAQNATSQTKAVAKATNLADLHAWLNPNINNPFSWTDAQAWASGNIGKKSIVRQEMHGVTLGVLQKERIIDFPVEPAPGFIEYYQPSAHQDTMNFVESIYKATGRYPFRPSSIKFYRNVIEKKKTIYIEIITGPAGILQTRSERNSTAAEIHRYTTIWNQMDAYVQALKEAQATTESAWDAVFKQTLWNAYVEATSPRTQWGYILKIKQLLIVELEYNVSMMAGRERQRLFDEFAGRVGKLGLPLNTNRFNRVAFTSKLNQLLYSKQATVGNIEKELGKTVGKILKNVLITTGFQLDDIWPKSIKEVVKIPGIAVDIPVNFGTFHCRIIVFEKPQKTCFVVFKGTKNFWEWVIDADFTGGEFSSIKPVKNKPGSFKLVQISKIEAQEETIKSIVDSTDTFLIHRGFLRIWKVFQPHVEKVLLDIYKTIGVADVIVTGHGMVSAVAQIACLEIPSNPVSKNTTASSLSLMSGITPIPGREYRRPHAYMFASPPVGDHNFTWHFNQMTSESAQVYIDGDVATMVPPFLIPSSTYAGITGVTKISDIFSLLDSNELKAGWGLLNRVYRFSNLPQFDLRAFQTRTGETDWKKVAGQGMSIVNSLHNHKATRGGGVFMVLSYKNSGHVDEFDVDPGTSNHSLDVLTHATFDAEAVRNRNSLDRIVEQLERVAKEHPDLFSEIEDNKAQWNDSASIHSKPTFPDPPNIASIAPGSKVLGFARSKKRAYPGSKLTIDDIHKDSIVMVPDMEEFKQNHQRQRRRLKIRKKTEGNYHGY